MINPLKSTFILKSTIAMLLLASIFTITKLGVVGDIVDMLYTSTHTVCEENVQYKQVTRRYPDGTIYYKRIAVLDDNFDFKHCK